MQCYCSSSSAVPLGEVKTMFEAMMKRMAAVEGRLDAIFAEVKMPVDASAVEAARHGDIVVLQNASDGYENLVKKVAAAMRWTASHVSAWWVVKMDDDVYVNVTNLWRRIQHVHLPTTRVLAARLCTVAVWRGRA